MCDENQNILAVVWMAEMGSTPTEGTRT